MWPSKTIGDLSELGARAVETASKLIILWLTSAHSWKVPKISKVLFHTPKMPREAARDAVLGGFAGAQKEKGDEWGGGP
ncbi:hypothetical protein B0H12DRAFT_1085217 [Mycena haematopus]|nr:hypothetical protein B0H12DRAFT_1085217 [Mycena haematopus]